MLFAGPIPPELGPLAAVEHLDLSLNQLEGEYGQIPYNRRLLGGAALASFSRKTLGAHNFSYWSLEKMMRKHSCGPKKKGDRRHHPRPLVNFDFCFLSFFSAFLATTATLHLNMCAMPRR